MAACVNWAHILDPNLSSLAASFVRISVNLSFLLMVAWRSGDLMGLWGDLRPSLWLRGLFGSLSLVTSFAAIKAIGMGESAFLHASNGVFVALLSPILLRQKNSPRTWLAIGGSLVGLYLLYQPRFDDAHPWGRALALTSGFLAALAYLMIAFAGRSNRPTTVVFYLCLAGIVVHAVLLPIYKVSWPQSTGVWLLLFAAGTVASAAQIFLTKSYQAGRAASNAAASYLLPVLNLIVSVTLFANAPDLWGWVGALVVVVCGLWLPLRATRPKTEAEISVNSA